MNTMPLNDRLSEAKHWLLQRRLRGLEPATAPTGIPRRPTEPDPPLSPAQHGVWLADQLRSDTSVSGVHWVMWLRGGLDVDAFRSAIAELVERHEVLRTTYRLTDAGPVQVVDARPPLPVELTTAFGDTTEERRAAALRLAEQSYTRPFDLERGPLFSVHVCEVDPAEHLVRFRMHHLVTDEWSGGLLAREMAALYAARRRGGQGDVPELPIQYGDYAAWLATPEQRTDRREQVAHWQRVLDGISPVLELPTDRIRPDRPSHRGGTARRNLSPQLSVDLRRLAAEHNTTMFSTLLAVFGVVLCRHSGQGRFAVGSLLSGRGRPEVENLLGMFASTVAIPMDITASSGFGDLLDRTGGTVVEALDNQDATFDQVVSALQLPRDASRNPLFQVLFQCMEVGEDDWKFDGLECEPVWQDSVPAKVDLTLIALNRPDGITLDLTYATDLYRSATAERILDHVVRVAEAAVSEPSARVAEIDMLTTAERSNAVTAWNATEYPYPATATVHGLFEEQAARHPERVAVRRTNGGTVSYAALNARANQIAHFLRARGVTRETLVGVCMDHSVDLFATLLGVLKAGAAYVPLDVSLPRQRMEWILSDTASPLVLTTRSLSDSIPGSFDGEVVAIDTRRDELAGYPSHNPRPSSDADNLIYIIYTSGSTGRPKGVQVPHRGVVNYLWWAIEGYGLDGERGAPMLGSIAFDLSVPNFWLPLIGGNCVTLLPADDSTSLANLAGELRKPGDYSLLKITPGHLDMLRGMLEPDSVHSVRTFVVGADEVRPETVSGWRVVAPGSRIINEYGPTETVVGCSVYTIPEDFDASESVSIGKPIGNLRMYVLDNGLNPAPVGVTGELYIGGEGVVRGYLNRPALTAEKFVPDPFSTPGGRLYRTGDLARRRADGDIEFLGRSDFQVKIRGYRIELGEVEARLGLHPEVTEAVTAAVSDKNGHRRLVGYVVASDATSPPTPAELREFMAAALPDYMVPTVFMVLDALPLTSAAKVDRTALPAPGAARGDRAAAATTETERVLTEIWSDLLQDPHIGVHDNFFEAGGDSILAIKLVTRLREAGYSVRPADIFRYQTIAEMSVGIARGDTPGILAEQGLISGDTALTPIQHWFTRLDVPHDHYNQAARIRLPKPTDPARLESALSQLIRHHDALRLRLDYRGGSWHQVISELEPSAPPRVVELHGLDADAAHPVMTEEAARAHESLSLTAGPLLRAVWFRRDDPDDDELLLVAHHLAVDTVSWAVLLEDLTTLLAGRDLPPKTTSFQHWSRRLTEYANSPDFDAEYERWRAHAAALAELPPLPTDEPVDEDRLGDSSNLITRMSSEETTILNRVLPASANVRVDEALLTALARAVLTEWGGAEVAVEIEGHGREDMFPDVDLTRTVGWFTATHPVVLRPTGKTAGDWIGSVRDQLRVVPNRGIGYGLARYLREGEDWPEVGQPQICFNYLGAIDGAGFESLGGECAASGRRPYLLDITAFVRDGALTVVWNHGACHSSSTMARLVKVFEEQLRGLLALAEPPAASASTPTRVDSRDVTDVYRLSPTQTGMLYQTAAEPDRRDYVEQFVFTLDGDLDPAVLCDAWRHVVARHPVLRTSFAWFDLPNPVQLVHRETELAWTELDCRDVTVDRVQNLLDSVRTKPLHLENTPPLRFQLIRLEEKKYYLVWTFHHILLDGWSVPIVLDEVLATYRGICDTGEPPALPEPVPYRNHIAWLEGNRDAGSEEFWSRALAGATLPTPIPVIGAESSDPEVRTTLTTWAPDRAGRLRDFAREHRVTVGSVLQAAWALRLSHDSGEPDVVFGTTLAGRSADLPGIDRMVGLLMTTLPARISVTDAPVGDWLRTVHTTLGVLRDHEHTPLRDIRRAAKAPFDRALFDSIFVFQNVDEPTVDATGQLRLELAQSYEQPGCPLVMEVGIHDELQVKLCYDRGRIDDSAARRLLDAYMDLLDRLIGSATRVGDLVTATGTPRPAAHPREVAEPIAHRAARDDVERLLSRLWSEVLDVPEVGAHDDFFDLGGDSILAMRIVAEARRAGVAVTTRQLFTARTIAAITAQPTEDPVTEPPDRAGSTGLEPGELTELLAATAAQDVFPLSPMQEGMLFQTLYEPDRHEYHRQLVLRLRGGLDRALLTEAWRHVIKRHGVLRGTFNWEDVSRPVQLIHADDSVRVNHADWSDLDESRVESRLSAWLAAEHRAGFELTAATPQKFDLITTGPADHCFVWQYHHLLLDGWSVSNVVAEVFENYDALLRTGTPPVKEPAPRFGDFAAWQQEQNTDENRAFWRRYLSDIDSPTPLPMDQPQGTRQDGGVRADTLPTAIWEKLQALSRREKVTVGAILHAAWAAVLSRHSGRRDVLFGSSLLGRSAPLPGIEDVVGMLMTTLPLRVSVEPGQKLSDYLRDVHDEYLEVRGHEHSSLTDVQRSSGVPEGRRLFDSIFIFQKPETPPRSTHLEITADHGVIQNGFPLICTATLTEELTVTVEYQHDAFSANTADRILADYLGVLHRMAEEPETVGMLTAGREVPAELEEHTPARASIEATLAEVWSSVLKCSNVESGSDFFALGGNSINAIRVVSLAKRAGLNLTLNDLFEQRTLAAVAAVAKADSPKRAEDTQPQHTVTGSVDLTPIQRWFTELTMSHDHFNQARYLRSDRPIDAGALEEALHALVHHHDALRSRMYREDGTWHQTVTDAERATLSHEVDLRDLPEPDLAAATAEAVEDLHVGLDLRNGPVIRAVLVRAGHGDALVVAAHHMVVDAVSWDVLVDDLNTAYEQCLRDEIITLPAKSTSYQQWARRLSEYARSGEFAAEAEYWLSRPPLPVPPPVDHDLGPNTEDSTRVVTATVSSDTMDTLARRAHHAYGATFNELLLTAMTRTLRVWTGRSEVNFDVEGHGREALFDDIDVSRTVGCFTTIHPFGIRLDDDDVGTAITAIRERSRAVPHNGIGFGLARYSGPASDADAVGAGQLLFNDRGQRGGSQRSRTFTPCEGPVGTTRKPRGLRPYLFEVDTEVVGGTLHVAWTFSTRRHAASTVSTLAGEFVTQLSLMAEHCAAAERTSHVPLVTDNVYPDSPLLLIPKAKHRIPGISVATMRDGAFADAWCHGFADASGRDAIRPGTVFQAGSISKFVTGIAVLRLAEEGLVDLDEDVDQWLSDWRIGQATTARQLLAHTAGLSVGALEGHHPDDTIPTLLDILNGRKLSTSAPVRVETRPGTRQRYSNSHYSVLQHLITSVTGEPFTEIMRSLVLDPSGMADSGFERRVPGSSGAAAFAHDLHGVTFPEGWRVIPETGAAGLWSTPRDLIRMFARVRNAFIGEDTGFLSRYSARVLLNPNGDGTDETADRWLRFDVGGTFGYQSVVATEQFTGSAVVIMTNGEGGREFLEEVTASLLDNVDYQSALRRIE